MHPAERAYRLLIKADGREAVDTGRLLDTADLIRSFSKFGELSAEAAAAVSALLTPRTFQKDEWLLRGGERAQWLFFIARGLVRELYIDAAGAEHVRTFLAEGGLTGSLVDLLSQQPAITWIQALEPTDTLAFPYSDFARLCDDIPPSSEPPGVLRKTSTSAKSSASTNCKLYRLASGTSCGSGNGPPSICVSGGAISRRFLASGLSTSAASGANRGD